MDNKLLNRNEKYIIGVSGGPDSMFLLDNIYHNPELDINNFIVCLVNYQKRADSDHDEQIVLEYCKKQNIKIYVKKVTSADYDKYQTISHNFQNVARDIRYDFFLQISKKYHCHGVLIAHNLTDHIETYILQKQRNGIVEYYGLNQISYYHSHLLGSELKIIRMMLKITREEIIEYLFHNQINYAIDSTNILGIYNRNIIRNEIQQINLQDMLLEINQKNNENKKLKLLAKDYLIDNFGQINVISFNAINNVQLQKIIIFNYFKINKLVQLISNKKRKFLDEIIKELKSTKPNIIIKVNNDYSLVKSYDNVEIINNNVLQPTTVKVTAITNLPIKWKEKIILQGTKNSYNFKIAANQFPLTITNDVLFLQKVIVTKTSLNRWFIKNKIPILARKSYFILDAQNQLVFVNNLVDLKINKFINNTWPEKHNLFFFMIK
ncbi:MAG: tRNA lysidine(34) synthetase TilS [Spiroplasma poulsonii]|uniref:tRNA(Ile)-lysidine synthase n=1 Tax=Spiroplasma poulsonii TaxID=2138 RepID=A0A2P6F9X4_9MOLU|nr:tRNA lysidine(34) synthetase TilS [Spiroplasma poulsonii]KAF0852067.1 tRNA(Ile)-lysidine synthase [Spiroplasma poulsonii]MBW1242146.1 tRNA lysidine(34) synthetase TilS [Spiroplasma poulsonii]PQM30257.1 tRNA(Ile)-lysidine synthase [Spiroplasma poulsonii]PWF98009.1 tRNA(Ile)-lysidine synthase [Spiroplasma poulsonii]